MNFLNTTPCNSFAVAHRDSIVQSVMEQATIRMYCTSTKVPDEIASIINGYLFDLCDKEVRTILNARAQQRKVLEVIKAYGTLYCLRPDLAIYQFLRCRDL